MEKETEQDKKTDKVDLQLWWADDAVYLFQRLFLPIALLFVLITGHLWGLPEGVRTAVGSILGLSFDIKGKGNK